MLRTGVKHSSNGDFGVSPNGSCVLAIASSVIIKEIAPAAANNITGIVMNTNLQCFFLTLSVHIL